MNNQEINEAELAATESQYWVQQKEDLEALERDPKFQRVILDGYFKDIALNQVSLLGTDYVKKNGLRAESMEILVAISTLQDHFMTIKNLGAVAEDDIQATEGPDVED